MDNSYLMVIWLNIANIIISGARGEKTNNNVSLKTPIKLLELSVGEELKCAIEDSMEDIKVTLFIEELILHMEEKDSLIKKIELDLEKCE